MRRVEINCRVVLVLVVWIFAVGCIGLACTTQSHAEERRDPAASQTQINRWVEQLDDRSFSVRELASKKLLKVGRGAIDALAAGATKNSLEVTDRSIRILDELASPGAGESARFAKAQLVLLAASTHVAASGRAQRVLRSYQSRIVQALERCGAQIEMSDDRIIGVDFSQAEIPLDCLRMLHELPDLEQLSFGSSRMDDAGLAELQGLPRVRELNLFQSRVGDHGLKYLKNLPGLRRVPMGMTRVTDAGLVHLKELTQLEYVGLRGNQVTDAGLIHLAGLKSLTGLNLSETKLTNAGLSRLQGLTKLNTLYLGQTQISDAGLEHLKMLPELQSVDLIGSQVTEAGVADLKTALPQLEVYTKEP